MARANRPRASILDTSLSGSLISDSPATDAAARSHAAHACNSGGRATPTKQRPASPSRALQSGATAKPQYAFGRRVDSSPRAPVRRSYGVLALDRPRLPAGAVAAGRPPSPQRVPAAARSSAASAASAHRSTSAPRLASAQKLQSRFQQHQTTAMTAARSKTPAPPAHKAAASGYAGNATSGTYRSPAKTNSRSSLIQSAESRPSARLRRSGDEPEPLAGSMAGAGVATSQATAIPQTAPVATEQLSSSGNQTLLGRPGWTVPCEQREAAPAAQGSWSSPSAPGSSYRGKNLSTCSQQDGRKLGLGLGSGAASRGIQPPVAAAASNVSQHAPAGVPKLALGALFTNGSLGMTAAGLHTPQRTRLPVSSPQVEDRSPNTPSVSDTGYSDIDLTPLRRLRPQLYVPLSAKLQQMAPANMDDCTPPLLSREHSSSGPQSGALSELSREGSRQLPAAAWDSSSFLSGESSTVSVQSAVAVAAKGLALPLNRLSQQINEAAISPPKHRRGGGDSPRGAAAIASQLLKNKAAAGSAVIGGIVEDNHARELLGFASQGSADGSSKALHPAGVAAGGDVPVAGPSLESPAGHMSGSTPGGAQQGLVPRLDLSRLETEEQQQQQQREQSPQPPQAGQRQQLLLEYRAPADVRRSDKGQQLPAGRGRNAADGGPGPSQRPSRRGGASGGSRGSGRSGAAGSRRSQPEEAAPPESFYVYESVVPAEETKTYEELRRALMKCREGSRLAASLQGIWGCYQDARRNTEAMAFRGHRLLDQVSNEYCSYKREAEQQLQHLEDERDAYREQAETALVLREMPASPLEIAAQNKRVQELQHQVIMLEDELMKHRDALRMAADYHHASEAHHKASEVPIKARAIAESATTSILFQQNLEQQEQLQQQSKAIEDMKAALLITCEALKLTNYMDPEGPVRVQLASDTVQVLDMMVASSQAEVERLEYSSALHYDQEAAAQPEVHIEELPAAN
eukprot:gene6221-6458_t